MQLTSINYSTISEVSNGEEESEIKCIDTSELFTPEIILRAQSIPDISIK